jgi:hypothetical protein
MQDMNTKNNYVHLLNFDMLYGAPLYTHACLWMSFAASVTHSAVVGYSTYILESVLQETISRQWTCALGYNKH